MRKWLKKSPFRVTINRAFSDVIHHCADVRSGETWISDQIQAAYVHLHHLGIAHSIEVWQGDTLVGGIVWGGNRAGILWRIYVFVTG